MVRLANQKGLSLRQSYARVGKFALIKHQRYAHAKQVQGVHLKPEAAGDAQEQTRVAPALRGSSRPSGHLKSEHRIGRNYLRHRQGDATNTVLAAVGYNFRRLIRGLQLLLRQILVQLIHQFQLVPS